MAGKLVDWLHLSGAALGSLLFVLWHAVFGDQVLDALWAQLEHLWLNLGIIAATVVVHELCHYLAYPRDGNARFGFSKKAFAPYAQYQAALVRERYILAACAPFAVLTVVPFSLACATGFSIWLALVSITNMTLSSADLYVAYRMATRAARGSMMDYDEQGFFATAAA